MAYGFAGGFAEGLNAGVRTGTLWQEAQNRTELVGLEKRQRELQLAREESAAAAEKSMNEAGFKVFTAWKTQQEQAGTPMAAGTPPPPELMLKIADARTMAAIDAKRPDMALAEAQKGNMLRELAISQARDNADREFALNGDVNAYTKALNGVLPGTNLAATQNPDGSISFKGTVGGVEFNQTASAKELPALINKAFDPKGARAVAAQMALERYKASLKPTIIPSGGKAVVGDQTIENQKSDTYQQVKEKDAEGIERTTGAFNTRTGAITDVGGGTREPASQLGSKIRKEISDYVFKINKVSDFAGMDPETKNRVQQSVEVGASIYESNKPRGDEVGKRLTPQLAANIGDAIATGKAQVREMADPKTGNVWRVVEYNGKRYFLDPNPIRTNRPQSAVGPGAAAPSGVPPIGERGTVGLGTNQVSGPITPAGLEGR